jgi:hypothetical protein
MAYFHESESFGQLFIMVWSFGMAFIGAFIFPFFRNNAIINLRHDDSIGGHE